MLCVVEDHSRNISVKVCKKICNEIHVAVNANFNFSPL